MQSYLIDLHMHTVANSHAYSTISEYVEQAKLKGLKIIAITDHGTALADSSHRWHFSNLVIVPRIINGIGILRGIEANILNIEGEIDCDDGIYKSLDIVLAGFHESAMPSMGIDKNTEAMIATIKNPKVNIISHPGNPNFPIHIEEVAIAAKEHNVALEINNSSYISRKGSDENCRKIAQAVEKTGGMLSLGTDSHIAYSIGDFSHCFELLKDIQIKPEQIINTNAKLLVDFLALKTGRYIPEIVEL